MLSAIAALAPLAFIGWIIYRAVRGKAFTAHVIAYAMACLTGVFTLAFFLSMNIPTLIKVMVGIFLGIALIFVSAYLQRRRQPSQP